MTDERKIALTRKIRESLRMEGFDIYGIAQAAAHHEDNTCIAEWIAAGKNGSMKFFERNLDKRGDITTLVEGARSVIVAGIRYYSNEPAAGKENYFVSRYARVRDYHLVIKEKLARVQKIIKEEVPDAVSRTFCDAGPVTEKNWAVRAGLGWRGKHSLVINRDIGSFFFLGEIVTTAEFIYDSATSPDHCGDCTLCIDACPTGAICSDRTIDARRCIAYLTIEHDGSIPEEFRGKTERIIFGCDRCQEVCPWNKKAVPYSDKELIPDFSVTSLTRKDWHSLTPDEFDKIFRSSAVKRAGYEKIRRNIDFADHR
ncbi:MAG TPA: tRNA epoxyqueuosine(34) reductase QueG [Bacteroidales bacterium]|nr:tRNA epoxyqueuosine(34) reductase QueG [Bacteroidales bacterium]MDI9532325.1 tRNA epoxyqueuosine(34) reductase QueG [Bacteroidota bacterium]MBK7731845.1 tRNA epoxyqueuosine(34) reductase QueG [Bacteroidales bacterium]MBP7035304.1 tRNA epoxyqueuosine(34) reductase QueG [Bacteroidales bacterium]MBP8708493.1 tRNA epoxyqueuosine(34) reductase QueG [Bacteroidales bacterium]